MKRAFFTSDFDFLCRTAPRSQFPTTNLKERIAALEQRSSESAASLQRATSPTNSIISNSSNSGPSNGALRDKIARFEKKGGVPVPRGRFGLGAPPSIQGPRKRGELYGNKIPIASRTASSGTLPQSRPGLTYDQRRSFSTSSVLTDFDDDNLDYSPMSSPTLTMPPDSPDSTTSVSITPDISPSLGGFGNPKPNITSFAKALEVARKAEAEKQARQNFSPLASQSPPLPEDDGHVETPRETAPTTVVYSEDVSPVMIPQISSVNTVSGQILTPLASRSSSLPEDDGHVEKPTETAPTIVVSSADVSPVMTPEIPTVNAASGKTFTPLAAPSSPLPEDDGHVETAPTIVVSSEEVSPVIMPEIPAANTTAMPSTTRRDVFSSQKIQKNKESSREPPIGAVITDSASPVIPTTHDPLLVKEGAVRVGTPPLIIRKRTPVDIRTPSVDKASKGPDTNAVPIEPQVPVSVSSPNPPAVEHDVSTWISDSRKKETVDSFLPTRQPKPVGVDKQVSSKNMASKLSAPEILPVPAPPDIVVLNEQSRENVQEPADAVNDPSINPNPGMRSRKLGLTLDSGKLNDGSLMTSPLQPGMSEYHLKMLTLKFILGHPHRVAPGQLDSFSTSLAAKAITSPDSLLSPPETGSHFGNPSSGGSSLGSRPMSMFETSPHLVTQILRMTPSTSRGVPMFLPANKGPPRKSDFAYYPPTPEDEETDVGSSTAQKPSHPNRMRSESDPEDTRSMPSKQTFSAVVHKKIRETPASAGSKVRPLPQTPKRATILETPLSPGHGELAALLNEALRLEDTLNNGELPFEETLLEEKTEQKEKRTKEAEAAKAEDEERSRLALATAQLQSKRDQPTSGRLKHTFLIPLSKARSRHRKEAYTAKAETFLSQSRPEPLIQSAGLSRSTTTNSFATASAVTLPKMPVKQSTVDSTSSGNSAAQLPLKSPKSSTFSSLRKFGSVSSATRTKHSTSSAEHSSEESCSVLSPENSREFGYGTGSTLSFPSVSPKKASGTLGRATSFAEKLWFRGRTKSGGSMLSSTSEVNGKIPYSSSTCQSLIIYV